MFAHGLADGELLHVPLLLAGCSHAGTGHQSSINPIIMANILWSLLLFHRSKLERLICKLIFQVIIPMDDDVTVLNRPVETKYYSPPPDHVHTEVNLWLYLYLMSIHYHTYHTCFHNKVTNSRAAQRYLLKSCSSSILSQIVYTFTEELFVYTLELL